MLLSAASSQPQPQQSILVYPVDDSPANLLALEAVLVALTGWGAPAS